MTEPVVARERLAWLRRSMAAWVLAFVLLGVAILVGASWTYAVYSTSSANPGNVVSAGSMSQVNSADNSAIMSASGLVPGDEVDGTVTIQNVGDAGGDFKLTVRDVEDTPGPGGGKLSGRLQVRVFEGDSSTAAYSGPLGALDVALGTWQPDEERSYRFVVQLPATDAGTDNPFQGSKVTATFEWSAVQSQ